jgi:hypothetical protein
MAIRFQRSAVAANGKSAEAMAFAEEIAQHFTEKFGVTVTSGVEIGGEYSRIHWFAEYEDLAQFEATLGRSVMDAEYMSRVVEGEGLFAQGSAKDTLVWVP